MTNALSNGTTSDPLRPPLPLDWGSQPTPKTAIAIISGTAKARDFKFGRYIHRVHPNTSSLKFWRKGSVGVSRDGPIFLSTQERVKLRTSNLADLFRASEHPCEQKPLKNLGEKKSVGVSRDCVNFSSTPYYLRNGQSYELSILYAHS